MIRRIFAIDPGMTGTGLVDLIFDAEKLMEVIDTTVITPAKKGEYSVRFQNLYQEVLLWFDDRPYEATVPYYDGVDTLIEQPVSDWQDAHRGQGTVAVLGGAWAVCCLAAASRLRPERIHQVPSQTIRGIPGWIPSRTKKVTYLAIVEAAMPQLRDQPEHVLAAAGMAHWWVIEEEKKANLERARS